MKHTDTPIKAYKVTDQNMQCRGFQFEIGVEYQSDNPVRCGNRGFHSCLKAADCFRYYDFNPNNRVFEVEIWGDYDDDVSDSKVASQYLRITNELTWHEVLDIVNTGKNNTGIGNTGSWNTGNWNAGDENTGNWNAGNRNTGNWNTERGNAGYKNTGSWNTGDWNAGDENTGDCNTGDGNTGNWNTGDWNTGRGNAGNWNTGRYNSCNYSTGYFNSIEPDVWMFNKPTGKKRSEIDIPYINIVLTEWIEYTDEEKKSDPQKALMGGYLKSYTYKEAWANWYETATQMQIDRIKALPNYDADVFYEITGLKI